jgi:hypothetical protein
MPNEVLTEAIDKVASGADLPTEEAERVMRELMEGRASDVQAAAFLIALRTKGETVDELTGFARTMRDLSRHVEVGEDDLLDTAGTGGGPQTFNVSTTAAIVAAGAGWPSTATGRALASRAPLMCWKHWARGSTSSRPPSPTASARSASDSCLRHTTTARCATSCRSARSWRCARCSTSSGHSPIRPAPRDR